MSNVSGIEQLLLSLLKGEYSHLSLTLNDHACNYKTVREILSEPGYYADRDEEPDWVSEDSRERAMETNRMWILHWYPNSPVGFQDIAAATLGEIVEYLENHADDA